MVAKVITEPVLVEAEEVVVGQTTKKRPEKGVTTEDTETLAEMVEIVLERKMVQAERAVNHQVGTKLVPVVVAVFLQEADLAQAELLPRQAKLERLTTAQPALA